MRREKSLNFDVFEPVGLPDGVAFQDQILILGNSDSATDEIHAQGLHIPGVLRVDNLSLEQGGTNYNVLLENPDASYLVADAPSPEPVVGTINLVSDGKVITLGGITYPTYIEEGYPEIRYTRISTQLLLISISATYSQEYLLSKDIVYQLEGNQYSLKEIRYLNNLSSSVPMIPASVERLEDSFNNCPNLESMDLSNCTNLNLEEVNSMGIRTLTLCFNGTTTGTLRITEDQKIKMDSLLEQDTEQNWVFKHNNNVKIEVIDNE